MDENKVKKRGWVKNAAIIFLAVMLVLTFFSNTIMNRSLPEVATQYVESGTITVKVRGTGTITANETYKVTSDVSKTVLSVPVKVGDEVKVGDRLVNFQAGDSEELKAAQAEYDSQNLAYKKAVINAAGSDYAAEKREIGFAEENVQKAKAKLDACGTNADAIKAAQKNYDNAKNAYEAQLAVVEELRIQIESTETEASDDIKQKLEDAEKELAVLKTEMDDACAALESLKAQSADYEAAQAEYNAAVRTLSDLVFQLQQRQREDGKTNQITALDLQDMKSKLDEQYQKLMSLKGGSGGPIIDSVVNGVVTAVNISAGNPVEAGLELIEIDIPDKGYGLSFPITIEQSKKVQIGDEAEIGSYWGPQLTAKIVAIKFDPSNPGKSKLLCFAVDGEELTSGAQYQVTASQHSQNYETVVPSSAIRSDSNGDFVLIVTSKATPLGNRYKAKRIDVKVEAKDDVNSAVSGGLVLGDYVITTATVPIEDGMYVRLPE